MEGVDRLLEGLALDEGHGVERPVVILPQAVDRHDAGVLEPGGDGGLAEEPPPRRVVELVGPDPLQGHRAVQLLLVGGEHFPQAATGVVPLRPVDRRRAQDSREPAPSSRAVASRVPDHRHGDPVRLALDRGRSLLEGGGYHRGVTGEA